MLVIPPLARSVLLPLLWQKVAAPQPPGLAFGKPEDRLRGGKVG